MMKLIRKMMISCRKTTELMEKRILFGLTLSEKINLYFHKSMCDACTAYEKQSIMMEKYLHRHNQSEEKEHKVEYENEELKERIKSKL